MLSYYIHSRRLPGAPRRSSLLVPSRWQTALACGLISLQTTFVLAADWPMWRYDANRSASSPDDLPQELQLSWTRQFAPREQVWDDPLNHDLMPYDRIFEPIIHDGKVFLGFNDRDKVIAIDLPSGKIVWEFYTDGPVRFPPAALDGKIFFSSDDGYLYCVRADDGQLLWRFRGGPSERKVIGNRRVISAWPARGGPVVRAGQVYFAASIWPFMGTFVYALDAHDGSVTWVNDSTSAQYIKQPHGAPSFAGVAPQGALVATENVLLVPGGRSVPAAFERSSGKWMHFGIGGKGTGGSFVCADEQQFYVHTRVRGVRACELQTGKKLDLELNEPVLCDGGTISFDGSKVQAKTATLNFSVELDGSGDIIQAGKRVYVVGKKEIVALNHDGNVVWSQSVDGHVLRLLAGDGKLIAVTLDGRLLVYGDQTISDETIEESLQPPLPTATAETAAVQLIQRTTTDAGYVLWYGSANLELLSAVLSKSDFQVVVVEPDRARVNELRQILDSQGQYGRRVTVHHGTPYSYKAPPYIAHLVVADHSLPSHQPLTHTLRAMYRSVRPYGGSLWIPASTGDAAKTLAIVDRKQLIKARSTTYPEGIMVTRAGPLQGSADWTHQYGDIANTVKSNDRRVKLPLGVLWFGGSSNMDILPRHSHGPPEQVIGGRTIIEGMDSISARDTYTGRVLWKRQLDQLNNFGVYFDDTYKNTPLSTEYNQVHIPGANGRGTNYVATEKEVFVAVGNKCTVLDAATGEITRHIQMPPDEADGESPLWGFIGIYEDVLLGGAGFANYSGEPRKLSSREGLEILDMSGSAGLVAFDRETGQVLWKTSARFSFLHNGIVAGSDRIYCLDRLPKSAEDRLRRRGLLGEQPYRLLVLDAKSGQPIWEQENDIFGTWLSYSASHDILLQAGALANDRLHDEVGQGMTAYQGKDGKVLWNDPQRAYAGPCILHHQTIITNANSYQRSTGAFNLLDGTPRFVTNPITGKQTSWQFTRNYGCNTVVASEYLLTFRSGAAGFYDLANLSGTGNFGGFRSSCTSNLVAAGGLLNAPDYTRTCTCSYQNQTSLALIHMPDLEIWTNSVYDIQDRVQRVGINFGAPGDRRHTTGTMWLDYPSVGGDSPQVTVSVEGESLAYFRRHVSAVQSDQLPWVSASGVEGITSVTLHVTNPESAANQETGIPIATGHDDAEERADGSMYLDSSDLELSEDTSPQLIGLRFTDIPLDPAIRVADARIQFTVDETGNAPTQLQIWCEASGNSPPFTETTYDISSRTTSTAVVSWSPAAWQKIDDRGKDQRTPNLATLVNEITSRSDWKPGNALTFLISGKGVRTAVSHEKHADQSPRLSLVLEDLPTAATTKAADPLYTVRLYFAEPDEIAPGDRVFDVALQDNTVLRDFDIVKQTGQPLQTVVKQFQHIPIQDELTISLTAHPNQAEHPLLNGVELISE